MRQLNLLNLHANLFDKLLKSYFFKKNNKNKVNKQNSPIKKQQKLATKAIIIKQIKIICQKGNMRDLFYESGV